MSSYYSLAANSTFKVNQGCFRPMVYKRKTWRSSDISWTNCNDAETYINFKFQLCYVEQIGRMFFYIFPNHLPTVNLRASRRSPCLWVRIWIATSVLDLSLCSSYFDSGSAGSGWCHDLVLVVAQPRIYEREITFFFPSLFLCLIWLSGKLLGLECKQGSKCVTYVCIRNLRCGRISLWQP